MSERPTFNLIDDLFMIQLTHSTGEPVFLKAGTSRKFKGLKLPGSNLLVSEQGHHTLSMHVFNHRLYTITLRQYQGTVATRLITQEMNHWMRLEVPLSGTLFLHPKEGESYALLPGQYQLTDQPVFGNDIHPDTPLIYMTVHFSPELLASIGSDQPFTVMPPHPVPSDLLDMLHAILKCPFQETLRNFYYANKIRELLFSHTVSLPMVLPGELSPEQIGQMYEADRIMAHNLDGKVTIPELAHQLGTNFVTLKKNYEKVFGIGIFPRLMQRKMEHIHLLLEKTNKPLKEIADMAGYQTLPGFINAFRKRFKVTPKEWRKERRGF